MSRALRRFEILLPLKFNGPSRSLLVDFTASATRQNRRQRSARAYAGTVPGID